MAIDLREALLDVLNDKGFEGQIKKQIREGTGPGTQIYTNLDLMLFSLNSLKQQINIISFSNGWGTFYKFTKQKATKTTRGELMTYGAKVIYTLREFFNSEQIYFAIGVTSIKGQTSAGLIGQREVLKKLSSINKKAIGLSNSLEKELIEKSQNNNNIINDTIMSKWQDILIWSNADKAYDKTIDSPDGTHKSYQKNGVDQRVYLRYYNGKARVARKYYDNDDSKFFNNGWLWQWLLQLAYSSEDGLNRVAGMKDLSIFFDSQDGNRLFKIDNVLGTKEGDITSWQQTQIQAKMNNNTIIRFNTILQIVEELTEVLNQYKMELQSEESVQAVSEKVKQFLMPVIPTINNEANEIVKDLLQPLIIKNI